jgi:hypothetical protein
MDADKIVVYQSYFDPINANIVKGLLGSYGIECFLTDENMSTLYSQYSPAIGGVKLNVFEKDIDRINSLLSAENLEPEAGFSGEKDEKGMICPECKSTNVGYGGSVNKKFGLWSAVVFSLISIFAMISYPFYQRKAFHCFDCNHEFKKT